MSSGEAGANTWAAMSKGAQAEALAEAMVGLEDTFVSLMDEISGEVGWISSGYNAFRDELQPDVYKIQQNGIQLANNIQAGASSIAENDYEASEEYQGAWVDIPEVNWE